MHGIACVACVQYLISSIKDGHNGSLEQCSDHVATRSLLCHPPIGHVAMYQKVLSPPEYYSCFSIYLQMEQWIQTDAHEQL